MILSDILPADIPTGEGPSLFDVLDPATEDIIARVQDTTEAEWDDALGRAVEAQKAWSAFTPRQRAEVLRAVFDELIRRTDDFARTMTLEMGKPLAEARGELAYGAEYFRWFSEEAVRLPGRVSPAPAGNGDILVTRAPVGPVLAITPWNFPLAMAARKIAPAMAAGCPVLVKPAAETPLTMLLTGKVIADIVEQAGGPRDLVQILPATDAAGMSSHLMADPRLRKVTFTGSTGVGKLLVRQAADNLLRTSMELGGNAPFVVNEDADLDLVLTCAMQAKMRNGGEACIAANRFLVHEAVAEEFTRRLTEQMAAVQFGHGLEEGITLGPVITAKQRDRIASLVDDTRAAGATVHCGGEVPERKGYFYPATVLSDVPADSRILREEIFGPVATVTTFRTLDEGIALANDTEFGLAAYGFSENVGVCRRFATELHAGMVGINRGAISDAAAPFGGVKQSGFGREGGVEGIEEYLDVRYVAL
ncbi:Succinate-semialdehyde dehydrogenase [NADP(+)] [Corynebacterium capitovis DSM 44611]|uniref:NAD-dependent succinate-semialdehyde dehydrogenase n=1 Tax=Corynebacterium capitovis TaxID=131081 RepID=UPI00036D1186|nr:NAD-dependent succinate-semialdehyde dehydrogenase [Corynebacterium capitovis]WKD58384.1 Succinate-semialdehyde dehydrogenase [NADP(+)] [Corynebacterium capitovis DSM 44611]